MIFKNDHFDSRLRAHKTNGLSIRLGRAIYAGEVEADLRSLFYLEANVVVSLDLGTHAVYRN